MAKILPIALIGIVVVAAVVGYGALREPPAPSRPIESAVASMQGSGTGVAEGEPSPDAMFLQIQPGASTVSFTVEEILRGEANTVVGTTDQVAGQIALDPDEPANTRIGTIVIGARTLATDDTMRNRMLHRFILATEDFEYITFAPSIVSGLPAMVTPGAAYPVTIDGKLTIKDVSRDVTFNANITPVSLTELRGNATTLINQRDFGITIPQVPFVAGVADEVKLDLNFVATMA
jgi:polyisoprenoid-binding protein YceI